MNLQAYLERIDFSGPLRADIESIRRLHRAHLLAIPYENLDVQLSRPVSREPQRIFEKLVTQRRGGWCYEMNGLFSWALTQAGVPHTRVAGAVMREKFGDLTHANHLVLLVHLEQTYIADVGFGDGMIEPIPLIEGEYVQRGFRFRLQRMDSSWWRLHNHEFGAAPSFDFEAVQADETRLDTKCHQLQTDPQSNFVLNAVVQRHQPDGVVAMRGRTFMTLERGAVKHDIATAGQYVATLKNVFNLDLPEATSLWPKIEARHAALFGPRSTQP